MTTEEDYWEKNGITKPQSYVVCAAYRYKDLIITGARHSDKIMNNILRLLPKEVKPNGGSGWEQGFINQFGEFLNRQEAMIVVKASGQPFNAKRNGGNGKDLYSEGIY